MPDSGLKWIHNAWLYYDSKKNFTPSTENNKSKTQQTDHISQFCYHTYQQSDFICRCNCFSYIEIQQHPFNGHFPGLPGWASTRKVKTIWILLKQEIVSGSGISWAICKSAPCSRQITNPLSFKQARCPSCHPTNSIKALKYVTNFPIHPSIVNATSGSINKWEWDMQAPRRQSAGRCTWGLPAQVRLLWRTSVARRCQVYWPASNSRPLIHGCLHIQPVIKLSSFPHTTQLL